MFETEKNQIDANYQFSSILIFFFQFLLQVDKH